jgi:dTDP-4-dehydrorhamnose reductase
MQKIMITGATGMLGRALVDTLKPHFNVISTGFKRATSDVYKLDLNDKLAISAFLDIHQPNVLIHAAAQRKPDVCEQSPEQTFALNVQVTQFIAEECQLRDIRLIFISTDYVFDGTQSPYIESSATNPLNFYGQSKQLAEQAVLASSKRHSVIRVPVLYGDVTHLAESAVTIIAEQISETTPSEHDHWAIRYPTHVEDIALTLKDLLKEPEHLGGIFHISNHQAMSKYDMACIIAEHRHYPQALLTPQPTPSQTAQRPYNCALKDTRLTELGIHYQRDFSNAIKHILNQH